MWSLSSSYKHVLEEEHFNPTCVHQQQLKGRRSSCFVKIGFIGLVQRTWRSEIMEGQRERENCFSRGPDHKERIMERSDALLFYSQPRKLREGKKICNEGPTLISVTLAGRDKLSFLKLLWSYLEVALIKLHFCLLFIKQAASSKNPELYVQWKNSHTRVKCLINFCVCGSWGMWAIRSTKWWIQACGGV